MTPSRPASTLRTAMVTRKRKRKPARPKLAMQTDSDYQSCADRLRALADPDRLRIVTALLPGARNVSDLAQDLDMRIVNVSHHLRVLRHANVVQTRKQGKFVIYSLHPDIAANGAELADAQRLDLGCCRLDLVQRIAPR